MECVICLASIAIWIFISNYHEFSRFSASKGMRFFLSRHSFHSTQYLNYCYIIFWNINFNLVSLYISFASSFKSEFDQATSPFFSALHGEKLHSKTDTKQKQRIKKKRRKNRTMRENEDSVKESFTWHESCSNIWCPSHIFVHCKPRRAHHQITSSVDVTTTSDAVTEGVGWNATFLLRICPSTTK